MTKVVMPSDQYYNCPICGNVCEFKTETGYNRVLHMQGPCQVFLCYHPLVTDPLHYYSHIVQRSDLNVIAYQEFSLDLGNKHIMFANNFESQKAIIKSAHDSNPLEVPFIVEPDFPYLTSLKKRVRTIMTFI